MKQNEESKRQQADQNYKKVSNFYKFIEQTNEAGTTQLTEDITE